MSQSIRRSISLPLPMHERLVLLLSQRERSTTEADLIREAVRRYLDEQEQIASSRRHFTRTFQERLDQLEAALTFHLNVLLFLLTADDSATRQLVEQAIIAARRDGKTVLAQMKAVREMRLEDE
ncbi:MAG: hypothetical protein SF029_01270 [bacterium]|nr:hypothetical protein [bacterium]